MEINNTDLRDILVFMSDQHTPYYSGFYENQCVDTPNLNLLSESGVTFDECYTVSPLCGPARMSLLSGIRPAQSGLFHKSIMSDTTATFLHCLVEQGYETVLVGRMHFIGRDQYHGFTKHIAKDMTPVTWCRPKTMRQERGIHAENDTFSGHGAASIAGGGASPVLEYDEFVLQEALKYLSEPHEKPQFVFVSIYGPHFPYIAPVDLYKKYISRVKLPENFDDDVCCSVLKSHQIAIDKETALACQAAYCGLVENMDRIFGQIWDAFKEFTAKRRTRSAVVYLSDHGDQCADRHIMGKETFYEKSVKIPFIMAGDGITSGVRQEGPVSIMDIGPTVLAYTGAKPLMDIDGISVLDALKGGKVPEHAVYSEFIDRTDDKFFFAPYEDTDEFCHSFMLRDGDYKFITFQGHEDEDALFDIKNDSLERHNLASEKKEILEQMREKSNDLLMHETALKNFRREARTNDLMTIWDEATGDADDGMRWNGASKEAAKEPEICVRNPLFKKRGR